MPSAHPNHRQRSVASSVREAATAGPGGGQIGPLAEMSSTLDAFRVQFRSKLLACTRRGFTVEESFEFLWHETSDELGIRMSGVKTLPERTGRKG